MTRQLAVFFLAWVINTLVMMVMTPANLVSSAAVALFLGLTVVAVQEVCE